MEQIRQAIELAKSGTVASAEQEDRYRGSSPRPHAGAAAGRSRPALRIDEFVSPIKVVDLDWQHLERRRIIAHNTADPRVKSFDMLRTQVLQSMNQRNWQFLAVTSPTPGCGKTVTAINLALSIARQPERSVLLVDLDFQKPQVANCLGLDCDQGVLSLFDGRVTLADAMVQACTGNHQVLVLPTEFPIVGSSELIASRAMTTLLQDIKRDFKSRTVIFDMPPMLASDDVIALLPQIDCVLLVAAVGTSTVSELKECSKHLQSAEVVRLVLNKASEPISRYYKY